MRREAADGTMILHTEREVTMQMSLKQLTEGYDSEYETQLCAERMAELERDIQQDEHPMKMERDESHLSTQERQKRKLKRQLRAEALTRLEEAARTEKDFENVRECWDKLDKNRVRRERYHEVQRDEVPLEYKKAKYGLAFPEWLNDPIYSAIQHGRNLDVIFNCTYELHQFTSHPILLEILRDLKIEYKDVLFFTIIREMSTKEFGDLLGQTDRNIRKKRMRLLNRIRKELYKRLKDRKNLSLREKQFLERYKNNALAESEDAEDNAEKRCAG